MSTGINFIDRMPPVTRSLIIINVIIWAFTAIFPHKSHFLVDICGLHYFTSPGFNPAQLITYMFLHGGFTHLFFNMFALFMFGSMLEWNFGPKRFIFFYISCGLGAALIQEGVYAWQISDMAGSFSPEELKALTQEGWKAMKQSMNFIDPDLARLNGLINGATIGASGAIYGILAAFAMVYPNRPLYIMFIPVPVKAKWVVLGYALLEFSLGYSNVSDNVAHYAHLGGMIVGAIIIYIWKKQRTIHVDSF